MATSHSNLRQMPLPIDGDTFRLYLTRGQFTIVDAIDADLGELKWTATFGSNYAGGGKYLAMRTLRGLHSKSSTIFIHRVILSRMLNRPLERTEQVDHKDGDPLNNRRENLRLATHSQNQMNKGKYSTNTSNFKGVSRHRNKWSARIMCNGKHKCLGHFATPELAHEAYCAAARELHGEFARVV